MLLRRTVLFIAIFSLVVAQDDLEIPTTEKPEAEGNAFCINSHQIRIIGIECLTILSSDL